MMPKHELVSGGFTLLPAKPGTCSLCATQHEPDAPHNYWSLHYGMRFKMSHGRDGTHADCCAHMTEAGRAAYRQAVQSVGKKWSDPPEGCDPIAEKEAKETDD